MEIVRADDNPTQLGPAERFTGTVSIETVAPAYPGWPLSASIVHFTPGARTAWHVHPRGQVLYVLSGLGFVQRRGGPKELIRPGDRVVFAPGEEHWHGAVPDHHLVHLALTLTDDEGQTAIWGARVTDDEYRE